MSQPQSSPYYPPPSPEKRGLSTGAIVAIVVAVVVVAVVVGAVIAGAFLAGVQNAAVLSKPNVAVTNTQGTYTDDCGAYGSQSTTWDWSATLVNNGGAGFANIGFDVNGQQVTQNDYYVSAMSQLPITHSATVDVCYGSTTPTYDIVLLAERSP